MKNQPLSKSKRVWIPLAAILVLLLVGSANPTAAPVSAQTQAAPATTTVSSPLQVEYEIDCTNAVNIQVNLDTSSYDVIARKIIPVDCGSLPTQSLSTQLYFDVFTVPTYAHLSITTYDEFNRTVRMYTNYVTLSEVPRASTFQMNADIPFQITEPVDGSTISDLSFQVKGSIETNSSSPLNIQLISEKGRILSHEAVFVPSTMLGKDYPFEATLYLPQLSEPTGARLVMQQSASDIYGVKFATSLLVTIDQK